MKKYVCDLCGEEIAENPPHKVRVDIFHMTQKDGNNYMEKHLHEKCAELVIQSWAVEKSWQEFVEKSKAKEIKNEKV